MDRPLRGDGAATIDSAIRLRNTPLLHPTGSRMTKSELIELVAARTNIPKSRAEAVVNTVFDAMVASLERGEGIEIRGFGSFTVREYKAYNGRNPRTGETVDVREKRLPFFKVGKELREQVNRTPRTIAPGFADASAQKRAVR